MKILRVTYHNGRRDFWADFECEFCGHVQKDVSCYDDTNFHHNVIPAMVCPKCEKVSGQITSEPDQPDWVVL